MRFSDMLAEEYVLIVPFAYQLQSGRNESRMAGTGKPSTEYIINCINFTQSRMCGIRADESWNISTAESPGRGLLFMKTPYVIILFCIVSSSCSWEPYPKEKYEIVKSYRDLINVYKKGDTMIFKSSQNIIDSFVISGIDSGINDKNGLFINARNSKSISVYYKQIPVDKWQEYWYEGGADEANKRSRDGLLIGISKFPDTETTEYYFNFKKFRCSKNEIPEVNKDTIEINSIKMSNYYKIDNCAVNPQNENSIKVCYSTIDKGLVAFKTYNDIVWTRQN